ncbi:MAG: hypothetical protein M0Z95_17295 [Actinomycetota bacterium]|nr:hypothetical protein [Actinomycetota bacterium]
MARSLSERLRRQRWLRPWAEGAVIFGVRAAAIVFVAEFAIHGLGPLSTFGIALDPGSRALVPGFFHWDAVRYLQVADHGYSHSWMSVYFPLYPLLVRSGQAIGLPETYSALAVSWAATYGLGVALIFYVRDCLGRSRWLGAVLLAIWAPASFFYFSGYPESIEALGLTVVLILVQRRRFLAAGLVAGVASASAPLGILFVIPVVVGLLQDRAGGFRWARAGAALVLSETGALAYSAYLWARFGNPLAYVSAESDPQWNRKLTYPFRSVLWSLDRMVHGQAIGTPSINGDFVIADLVNDAVAIAAAVSVVLLVAAIGRRRLATSPLLPGVVLAAIDVVFNVSDGTAGGLSPEALARLLLTVVPLYVVVTYWRRDELVYALVAISAVMGTAAQTLFFHNLWFT